MSIKISKLDAARRQLDAAIELWFRDGDPVAIHTLASAAYEIAQDLNLKHGNKHLTLAGWTEKFVVPGHEQEVIKLVKKPMLFFKHANRDPHGILEFQPEVNDPLFVMCMGCMSALGEQPSDTQRALTFWHCIHKPDYFLKGANLPTDALGIVDIENMRRTSKSDFLKQALQGIALSKSRN